MSKEEEELVPVRRRAGWSRSGGQAVLQKEEWWGMGDVAMWWELEGITNLGVQLSLRRKISCSETGRGGGVRALGRVWNC